jgi:isoquinoline 1-oxidoreductase beta subunit
LRFDDTTARAIKGVRQVIPLEAPGNDYLQRGGIAVLADSTWTAIKGRNALDITWDEGSQPPENSAALRLQFQEILASEDLPVIREDGDVKIALSHAVTVLEATYEVPLLAHVTMEPMNYTAWVQPGKVEVWGPTQVPDAIKDYAQQLTKVPTDDITVHITRSGGGFGRRLAFDYGVDALQLSQKANAPVQVVWTREDDLANDFYRPAGMFRIRAGIDANGRLIAWYAKCTTTSRYAYRKSTRSPHITEVFPDELPAGMVPNYRLEYKNPPSAIPVGAWRTPRLLPFNRSSMNWLAPPAKTHWLSGSISLARRGRCPIATMAGITIPVGFGKCWNSWPKKRAGANPFQRDITTAWLPMLRSECLWPKSPKSRWTAVR